MRLEEFKKRYKRQLAHRNPLEVPIGCLGTRIVHHLVSVSSLRSLIATNRKLLLNKSKKFLMRDRL